jgi:hypothetical protein
MDLGAWLRGLGLERYEAAEQLAAELRACGLRNVQVKGGAAAA